MTTSVSIDHPSMLRRPAPSRGSFKLKLSRGLIPTAVATISICALCSRGLFQFLLPQSIAYFATLAPLALFALWMFARGVQRTSQAKAALYILLANLILGTISAGYSAVQMNAALPMLYLPFYLLTPVLLLWTTVLKMKDEPLIDWYATISIAGWYLVIFGILEIIGVIEMPGSWVWGEEVRGSGPTGSKQHFSIIMGIIAVMSLQFVIWRAKGWFRYISFSAFSLMTVATLTRSGILILGLGICFSLLLIRSRRILTVFGAALFSGLLFLGFVILYEGGGTYVGRLTNFINTEGGSDSMRLYKIELVVSIWAETNMLVGEWFGSYTQVAGKIMRMQQGVSESSFTATLAHSGLLGLLAYYSPFVLLLKISWRCAAVLTALLLACAVQSVVYMSMECLPYVVLLGLTPMIIRSTPFLIAQTVRKKGTAFRPKIASARN